MVSCILLEFLGEFEFLFNHVLTFEGGLSLYDNNCFVIQPEDFWIRAQRKGIVVFALPGEPGLTELVGDFKVHFHDRQGDFYWFVIIASIVST